MRKIYSVTSFLIRIYMKLCFNYRITGKEHLQDWKTCIVAANHISYYDPPFIGSVLGQELSFLAKKELFSHKLIGRFLRFFNAVPVKRGIFDRAALQSIVESLSHNHSLLLFPEGSRKSFTAKPGIGLIVYDAKIPVLPVKIVNSNDFRGCFLRKKRLLVIVGKRIEPQEYEHLPAGTATYRKVADDILNRINALQDK